jgi:Ca2+-binding RTX toxin-like protein
MKGNRVAAPTRICVATAMAVLATLWLGAANASASSLVKITFFTADDGMIRVTGDDGANNVTLGIDPNDPKAFLISDASGILEPLPPGCVRLSQTSIRCPAFNNIKFVQVDLEGSDDRFAVGPGSLPKSMILQVTGGPGADTIRGRDGPGFDNLYGDGGKDRIFGEGGNDRLTGGPGQDELDGGTGDDALYGEEGEDILSGGDGFGQDYLDGGPDNDVLNGLAEDDKLFGGMGNDRMSGGKGDDRMVGGPGRDGGAGGPGQDLLVGGKGADKGTAEKKRGVER